MNASARDERQRTANGHLKTRTRDRGPQGTPAAGSQAHAVNAKPVSHFGQPGCPLPRGRSAPGRRSSAPAAIAGRGSVCCHGERSQGARPHGQRGAMLPITDVQLQAPPPSTPRSVVLRPLEACGRLHHDRQASTRSTVSVIAAACRDSECLRFGYRSRDGTDSRREVEPRQLHCQWHPQLHLGP
jgi:hypothetical protein